MLISNNYYYLGVYEIWKKVYNKWNKICNTALILIHFSFEYMLFIHFYNQSTKFSLFRC